MVLILSMILSTSFAEEEITVSGRVNAEFYADQALEQNYGITLLLQEYFIRTVEEKDSNIFIVRYEGMENYAYVLGRYEVTVDRNQIVGITWSVLIRIQVTPAFSILALLKSMKSMDSIISRSF